MSDLDKEELEATRNMGKTADETENEIEKIIQFMLEDNYNISFISSIRSLMALYKTYLSLYNKEKEKNKELEDKLIKAKEYIENEMYINENPTICGDEEDTLIDLPISLILYNEDLRELLRLLEEE